MIPAVNGQVTIVRNDLENTYNVFIPGIGSFHLWHERPGARLVNRPRPVREAAARAAVLLAKAGRARHPQRQTCGEAGQGAVVCDSFEGTRIMNGRGGPATA